MRYFICLFLVASMLTACSSKKGSFLNKKTSGKNNTSGIVTNGKSGVVDNNILKNTSDSSLIEGKFKFSMSGYKGLIEFVRVDGKLEGTIKFDSWGNGVPQPLKRFKINKNRIFFERSMSTSEELKKYGGRAYFKQEFYGIFSDDWSRIKGYYRYLGAQDNWEAKR